MARTPQRPRSSGPAELDRRRSRAANMPGGGAGAAVPGDVWLMNSVAGVVFVLVGAGVVMAGVLALLHSPMFPVRGIDLQGELSRTSLPTLRAHAAPALTGNFFTLDLQASRKAFEAAPWVRRAVVRRVWPDRLAVQLEEHRAAALWQGEEGADRLVNTHGEVFAANLSDLDDDTLPVLSGPEDSAADMLMLYERVQASLQRLNMNISRVRLSSRGSWRVELDSGTHIELGRGNAEELLARTERFVGTLAQATASWQAPLEYADLRHSNGYAVRLRGINVAPATTTGSLPRTPTERALRAPAARTH